MVASNIIDFSSKIEGKLVEENAARICAIKLEGMREQSTVDLPEDYSTMLPSKKVTWLWGYALEKGIRY